MRLPRLRQSVRYLIALISLSALLVWSAMMIRRSLDYRNRAAEFNRLAHERRASVREHVDRARRAGRHITTLRKELDATLAQFQQELRSQGTYEREKARIDLTVGKKAEEIGQRINEILRFAALHDEDVTHYERLAAEYRWATWHPWAHIDSTDPPSPLDTALWSYTAGEGLHAPELRDIPGSVPPSNSPVNLP